MIINIRIADPDNKRAHNSLHNWLNNNQYIKENAQLKLPNSAPDGMGPEFGVIQLVLSSGFDLANLALAFAEWRDKSRETAAPIAVQANGRTTELSLDDMADFGDEAYVVRRALAGAPDPRQSSCVVIGVSDYGKLRELPAVRENLVQLPEVLADPETWGIPPERLHTIAYPQSADAIRDAISAAAQDAPDTLLVYFAGHGLYDRKDGLLLALPEATGKDRSQTVPWQQLAEVIRNADSHRRIVWLDCCYAGLALPDKEATPDKKDPPELLEVAEVEGTYLLAAAQKYEEAKSPDGEGCTAFTGELVKALRDGIAPGPPAQEFLSLNSLHQQVRSALRKKHLPEPNRHDPGHIGQLPHFRNLARGRKPRTSRSKPPLARIMKKVISENNISWWSEGWYFATVLFFLAAIALIFSVIFRSLEPSKFWNSIVFQDISGVGTLLAGAAAWFSAFVAMKASRKSDSSHMQEMINLLKGEHELIAKIMREQQNRMMFEERELHDRRMRDLENSIKIMEQKIAEKERRRRLFS